MPRFMQQDLFEATAIFHTIFRLRATAAPDKATELEKQFSGVVRDYIRDYPDEDYGALLADSLAASQEVEQIAHRVYDGIFGKGQSRQQTRMLSILDELFEITEQESRKKRPLIKRIFGGTLWNYEKTPLKNRVQKCREHAALVGMMILAKALHRRL